MLIVSEKSRKFEVFLSENERANCLGNSIRTLEDSEGPADIWTYKHMLSVI